MEFALYKLLLLLLLLLMQDRKVLRFASRALSGKEYRGRLRSIFSGTMKSQG